MCDITFLLNFSLLFVNPIPPKEKYYFYKKKKYKKENYLCKSYKSNSDNLYNPLSKCDKMSSSEVFLAHHSNNSKMSFLKNVLRKQVLLIICRDMTKLNHYFFIKLDNTFYNLKTTGYKFEKRKPLYLAASTNERNKKATV